MRAALLCVVACAGSGEGPARLDLETLPTQLGCADDVDTDPANGVQFRVSAIASGEGIADYERFVIENSTTDVVIEAAIVEGVFAAVQSFAYSHNAVFAIAIDDDGVRSNLFTGPAHVVACCGMPCRSE